MSRGRVRLFLLSAVSIALSVPVDAQLQVAGGHCKDCYPVPPQSASCTCTYGGCDRPLAFTFWHYRCGPEANGWVACLEVDGYIGWSAPCVDDYNYGLIAACAVAATGCGGACGACAAGGLPFCAVCVQCIGDSQTAVAGCTNCAMHFCFQDLTTTYSIFGPDACCELEGPCDLLLAEEP
jgi:hypothetical protein